MKTTHFLSALILSLFLSSCSNDDDTPPLLAVTSEKIENLNAPQEGGQGQPISGEFTKFDFETGAITTSNTDWDIAFRGTTILVNGGTASGTTDEPERTSTASVYIASGTLASIIAADTSLLTQDSTTGLAIPTGSDNGWYNYSGEPNFLITPLAGKVLVVQTSEGNFAKVEILSYYKDAPTAPNAFTDESKYYTFNYVYQPNSGITNF